MNEQVKLRRFELINRYLFEGKLEMQTALHIGGGKSTLSPSDSPVVLTAEDKPFIPGSSFKGALRSTIEKLVPSLPASATLRSCGLIERGSGQMEGTYGQCPTVRMAEIANRMRLPSANSETIREEEFENLCNTCLLFGSPFAAARINVSDLYLAEEWAGVIQVRDGVAIDRDSESAKNRLKYDFEVVPSSTAFQLTMTLENATLQDLQLISIGLSDFMHRGFGMIGGKRSRGLGACFITGLKVSALELGDEDEKELSDEKKREREQERKKALQDYLLNRKFPMTMTGQEFLEKYIPTIFK